MPVPAPPLLSGSGQERDRAAPGRGGRDRGGRRGRGCRRSEPPPPPPLQVPFHLGLQGQWLGEREAEAREWIEGSVWGGGGGDVPPSFLAKKDGEAAWVISGAQR